MQFLFNKNSLMSLVQFISENNLMTHAAHSIKSFFSLSLCQQDVLITSFYLIMYNWLVWLITQFVYLSFSFWPIVIGSYWVKIMQNKQYFKNQWDHKDNLIGREKKKKKPSWINICSTSYFSCHWIPGY